MAFPNKKRNAKAATALKRARREAEYLRKRVDILTKEKRKLAKRCQRVKHNATSALSPVSSQDSVASDFDEAETPRKRTRRELRQAGVSPRKMHQSFVKKITMANAIFDEIKVSKQHNKSQKAHNVIHRIISGKVVKRSRCISALHQSTGIPRLSIMRANTKSIQLQKRARLTIARACLKNKVIEFMKRDDVSVSMPGKNDVKSFEGEKHQTRILNDYLSNVYEKFKSEHPDVKVSLSLFCSFRPRYVLLTSCISRNTCLCIKHQNMAIILKCLRSLGLPVSSNPEVVCRHVTQDGMEALLNNIGNGDVQFDTWKRVDCDGKKRMKLVQEKKSRDDYIHLVKNTYSEFLNHVGRVKTQYAAIRQLKDTLPKDHIVLQMDFAENFTCGSMDEVQSAYWNATNVTLHPVVVYYRTDDDALQHKNYIFVSDVNHHNSIAVITIIKIITKELRETFPEVKTIHYWTDSPSSQYRNRFVINTVVHHYERYGFHARWNYFESGHGKGPCDGLGGAAKRQAADAIKQGKATIQDASDFFAWASGNEKSIHYRFYSEPEYQETSKELEMTISKPIPGTLKIHAVCPSNGELYSRDVSCYCQRCLLGDLCEGWTRNSKKKNNTSSTKNHSSSAAVTCNSREGARVNPIATEGDYVAAMYDCQWYIGKVIEYDEIDDDYNISFMQPTSGKNKQPTYKWPTKADVLWVKSGEVLCTIGEPKATGKSQRQFMMAEGDYDKISNLVAVRDLE